MTLLKGSLQLLRSSIRHITLTSQPPSSEDHYRQQSAYCYFLPMQTRWHDNDQYGHVNNSIYYNLFDTIIGNYLVRFCGLNLNLQTSTTLGFIAGNQCSFHAPVMYPQNPLAGLAVEKIGRSSVHYKVALFPPLPEQEPFALNYNILTDGCFSGSPILNQFASLACATGSYTQVFIQSGANKPKNLPVDFERNLRKILQIKDPVQ